MSCGIGYKHGSANTLCINRGDIRDQTKGTAGVCLAFYRKGRFEFIIRGRQLRQKDDIVCLIRGERNCIPVRNRSGISQINSIPSPPAPTAFWHTIAPFIIALRPAFCCTIRHIVSTGNTGIDQRLPDSQTHFRDFRSCSCRCCSRCSCGSNCIQRHGSGQKDCRQCPRNFCSIFF